MDAIDIDLGYWHVRFDQGVLEILNADGTGSRIHSRHVLIQPFEAAVDQRNAPGGMSVTLHSIRRNAMFQQFDVPVDRVPAVQALLAKVAVLQGPQPA